jgi:hypothetical protein
MCSDPLVDKLREQGYNPVRLPRADIGPLQILSRSGKDLSRLGAVGSVLKSKSELLPRVHENVPAAKIEVRRSGSLKAGLGASLLGAFLEAFGAKGAELDSSLEKAQRLVFEFNDVLEDRIDVSELDTYLVDSDLNPKSRYTADLLVSDGVYIVTAILKSKKFAIEAHHESGGAVKLDADAIKNAVSAKGSVETRREDENKIVFEGGTFLTFAFQAVRLLYYNGGYTSLEPVDKVYLKGLGTPPAMKGRELFAPPGVFTAVEPPAGLSMEAV